MDKPYTVQSRQFLPSRILISVLLLLSAVMALALGSVRTEAATKRRVIIVGDSRTEMMKEYCGGASNVIWSCKSSMGLTWMKRTGVPQIESKINGNTSIAILMGVNDCADTWVADQYASYLNTKAKAWKKLGASTYFFSITPVNDKLSKFEKNSWIKSFNARIKAGLSSDVKYVNIYSTMAKSLKTTSDGLHYTKATSQLYYNLVMKNCGGNVTYTAAQLKKNPDLVVSDYYKPVYNFADYMKYNPSLKAKYGNDPAGAYNHFLTTGMAKGLQGSAEFDPVSYRLRYTRVRHKYQDEWKKYYIHYLNIGKRLKKSGKKCTQMMDYDTVYNGVDYKYVYNYNEYIKLHRTVFKVYGYKDHKVLAHFVKYGIKAGWSGNNEFRCKIYKQYNPDLAKKFGNDPWKYFDHYLRKGYNQTWRRHK